MTSAIVNRCSEVLAMGRDVDIIESYGVLCMSHLVRILLPLVVTNISPLATSDPRVNTVLIFCSNFYNN